MKSIPPTISKEIFAEVLQDDKFIDKDTLQIFQTIYSADNQELSATDIAKILRWKDKMSVVGKFVSLGKRMEKYYGVITRERKDGSKSYWDLFFTGYQQGRFFMFQLRPELKKALEECCLVDGRTLP